MTTDQMSEAVARALETERSRSKGLGKMSGDTWIAISDMRLHWRSASDRKYHAEDLTTPEGSAALIDAMDADGWTFSENSYNVGSPDKGWAADFYRIPAQYDPDGKSLGGESTDPDRHVAILKAAYEALKAMGRIGS